MGDGVVEVFEGGGALGFRSDLTFPHSYHAPAGELKVGVVGEVARIIHRYLMAPEDFV